MAVTDNQLLWRRVFADTGKDVSGWALAKRMALPPWCFGDKKLYICRIVNVVPNSDSWMISTDALPDPACIWAVGLLITKSDHEYNYLRMGLRATVPISTAEMDGSQNIFPDLGNKAFTPPRLNPQTTSGLNFHIPLGMGVVTGAKKFVAEGHLVGAGTILSFIIYLVVSALPDAVPAFLNPDIP